jgi:predicted amidohydrolase
MIPPAQQPRAGVTVVIAQTSTKIGGGAERLRAIEAFVSERSPQADTPQTLLVLPELFMSGYAGTLR